MSRLDNDSSTAESFCAMPQLLRRGKVRDIYAWRDEIWLVASDRISAYDVIMPTPIPDKGQDPHRALAPLVRADRAALPKSCARLRHSRRRGQTRVRRTPHPRTSRRNLPDRVRGAWLRRRFRLGGIQNARHGRRPCPALRTPRIGQAARAAFHPRAQERRRPRREPHRAAGPRLHRRCALRTAPQFDAESLRLGGRLCRQARHPPRRHQARVRSREGDRAHPPSR